MPATLNQLLGTKYKIVLGYNGTADTYLRGIQHIDAGPRNPGAHLVQPTLKNR